MNGSGLSHEWPWVADVTCHCYTCQMFDSHFLVIFSWRLSLKNRFVRDPSDDVSEDGYYYPSLISLY